MVFRQFSGCDSVISNGLRSATGNLNHLGIGRAPSKSTVAYQNKVRDSGVFRKIYYAALQYFGQQAQWRQTRFRFKMPVKMLDSTLVSLAMELYDWAHYTATKGAVKMHTLLDYASLLPDFIAVTDGKGADNTVARNIPVPPHCVLVADRIYSDYGLLSLWDNLNVFFVVRHKQLLRIKSFVGTSRNAVETQIWTATLTMPLLRWLKHIARYDWALANLVVSLRLNTFTKIDLFQWINEPFSPPPGIASNLQGGAP